MPGLSWSSELDIGIYEIDVQHRSLVAITNQLYDALENGREDSTIEWILEELLLFIKLHFQTEEKYMRRSGAEGFSEHKDEHKDMLRTLRRLIRRYKAGEEGIGERVLDYLYVWIEDHLNGQDRLLGERVRAAGGKSR